MRALVAAFPGRNNVSWKYICPGKKLCFSLLSSFQGEEMHNGEHEIHWSAQENERRELNLEMTTR